MSESNDWLATLVVGDKVWWNDPHFGMESGYYRVLEAPEMLDLDFMDQNFILMDRAGNEREVFASELSPERPDGLYPVVDGETGSVDVYGHASSREGAIAVGNEAFCEVVKDAYLAEGVLLATGNKLSRAWVAVTA